MTPLMIFAMTSLNPMNNESFTEIEDKSELSFLSSDLKTRKIGKIALDNGMQILLISDPKADLSSTVVSVGAGSWNDPLEYPGMAHFCEHMLFMGTEKYPDTNDFFTKISNFDGMSNAFTAPDKTVYMFSCHEKGFQELLDRFAHFFIDPLFNPSNIAREMHAVDQEFALQKENDGWREYMVFKEMANPNHPIRLFSTGNSKTLSNIPQSALKNWHQNHYSANRMKAAIYSSLPLDSLKKMAAAAFEKVPNSSFSFEPNLEPIISDRQKGHLISIQPINHCHNLSLTWELPASLANDETKSADLVAYALGRGQKQSLLQKLKTLRLVDDLSIRVDRSLCRTHAFFEITAELSDLGMKQKEEVVSLIFQALSGLKTSSIPKSLFDEKNTLATLSYQYQNRIDAFEYISSIGRSLANEDMSTYPQKTLLGTEYNKEKIALALDVLSAENCSFVLLAPQEIQYDKKEKWLQVPYTTQSIPPQTIAGWSQEKPNPDIQLAEKNPFTPQNLKTIPDPNLGTVPVCIAESNFGKAFYVRLPEYQNPEGSIHLHIHSHLIAEGSKGYVLTSLYLDHLTDVLHPILSAASGCGLQARFEIEKNHLHLTLSGFSEKMPLLLQEIVQAMPQNPPSKEQFDLYFARHEKSYANGSKALPVKQAKELLVFLINPSRITKEDQLSALRQISYEDLLFFHQNVFNKSYFQALFAGNLSVKDAESSWLDIIHHLNKLALTKSEIPELKALQLPEEEGPFQISQNTNAQGNATILLIDEGNFSFEKKSVQKVLAEAIQEPFFDTLRTKQKTGYIAQSGDTEFEKRLYQYFLVQSNTHQPEDLLHRFELFLEEYRQDLTTHIPEDRFETLKMTLLDSLKTQYRNIKDKSALFDSLAFDEKEDFDLVNKKINALEALNYTTFCDTASELLSRNNRKRLAILYTGKIATPFTYLPTSVKELPQVAKYAPREHPELNSSR